jgi:alkanesulfonate monooxygenase SsuD/methylene tetrahydromethanopterin reductase-like flavin-dependent oxidoreductase (luciferase family)
VVGFVVSEGRARVGDMTRIGAIVNPHLSPPEALRELATTAESAGLEELWLWEDCFLESAYGSAGAALAWTDRLRIGIGIAPMPLRTAVATAMEIATLERTFPGRLIPGLGHGVQSWMAQAGARVASPLTLMREQISAVRSLLAGDEVTVEGRYVTLVHVKLDWPPASAPAVYAAAEGPKTLRLSGEVADGTILTSGYPVETVAQWVAAARAGREASGRGGHHDIVAYLMTAFGADAEQRALEDLREWEHPEDLSRVATGTPEQVAETVRRWADAGVDAVILQPLNAEPDPVAFLGHCGEVARLFPR